MTFRHLFFILFAVLIFGSTSQAENWTMPYTVFHGDHTDPFYEQNSSFLSIWDGTNAFGLPRCPNKAITQYLLSAGIDSEASGLRVTCTPDEDHQYLIIHFALVWSLGYGEHTPAYDYIRVKNSAGQDVGCSLYMQSTNNLEEDMAMGFVNIYTNTNLSGYRPWDIMVYDLSHYIGQTLTIECVASCCSNIQCYTNLYLGFEGLAPADFCNDCVQNTLAAPIGASSYEWHKDNAAGPVVGLEREYVAQKGNSNFYYCSLGTYCGSVPLLLNTALDLYPDFDLTPVCDDNYTIVYVKNNSYMQRHGNTVRNLPCDTVQWDFGNGYTSTNPNIKYVIYNEPGEYTISLRVGNKDFACDSTITKTITIGKKEQTQEEQVACTNELPFVWRGKELTKAGLYKDTIKTVGGCDSILQLNLSILPFTSSTLHYELCSGEKVKINNRYYSTAVTFVDTVPNAVGCDSIITTVITIKDCSSSSDWGDHPLNPYIGCDTTYSTIDTTIAYSILLEEPFQWFGKAYSAPGVYHDTLFGANHDMCDSIGSLLLRVIYEDSVAVCNDAPYTFTTPWGEYTTPDGCDCLIGDIVKTADNESLVWAQLCVTRLQPTDSTTIATICEGETFNWYGRIYKENKDTAMTLTNAAGCDSICTLKLTVLPKTYKDTVASTCSMPYYWHGKQANDGDTIVLKNANGCDSIVTLRLTVLQPTDSTTIATICEGETFNWYGQIYKESKTTTMTLTNAAGCDSICTLRLTVLPVTRQRFGRSICEGTTTTWRGRVLDKAGTYDTILYYINGCDSIRDTLDLTIDEMYRDSVAYKICQGEHITWRGNTYTNAGDYSEHAIGKNGDCDSILKLHIDVALPTRLDTVLYRCYSDPFPFNWEGHSIKRAGDTVLHITNKAGCDSAIYVTVYQSPEPYTIEEDSSFCDGSYIENWHGKQIWNGGTYYATEKCKNPHFATCDSINYILHVTKKYPTHGDTTVYVCACEMPITWDFQGQKRTLADPGTYNIRTLTNVVGCDSTLSITIVVSDEVKTDIIDTTLCEGSSIQWQGRTIERAGSYFDTTKCKDIHFLRCDSIYHELHVTIAHHSDSVTYATICRGETFEWHGETYTETTHRTITIDNAAGCDSVCTLHLTVNEPSSSLTTASICMGQTYQWNGYSFTNSVDTTIQLLNSAGCDSLCRLVLTAAVCCPDTQMRRTVIPSMCDTLLPYQWQTWRTQPILINDPGSYADTLRNKWGCDSIIYTLDIDFHHCCRDLKGEMNVGDVCADDDYLSLSLDLHSGMMNEYRLHFTNPTLNKMPIRDTVVHFSEEDWATGTIHIDIPIPHDPEDSTRYPRPDNYFVDVLVSDSCGNTLRWEQVPFTIFYPSWLILQRWNDVLALYNEKYNGGYTFSQIRWFHEDTLLTARGEHDGYIYVRPTLEYGTPYYAELTRTDDGKTFPTCAYFPRPQRDTIIFKEEVEISHNLIGPGANRIGVKTNTNGTYDIYDIGGHCVQHGYFGAEHDALYIDFNTRLPEGVYILLFRGKELLQPEKLIHDKE